MPSQFKSLIRSLIILILLVGAQVSYANSGKAFSITGTATVNDEPLTLSTELKEGDIIKTTEGSAVKVIMQDKTVLDINEKTSFKITKYAYNKDAPDEGSSSFSLLKGTFRYISGLIAKKDPNKVKFSAGTATIGIRGTFSTIGFDGTEVSATSSIGTTKISFADGTSITVSKGQTGSFNFSTGRSSVGATTSADSIGAAALAIAADPATAAAALADMSAAEQTLVMAAIMNNTAQLGVSPTALTSIVSNVVAANPAMAVGLAYVAGALNGSSEVTNAIIANAPEGAEAAIEAASNQGENLEPAPATGSGESQFPLRTGIEGEGEGEGEAEGDPILPGGSPLDTETFISITEEANS
jgi:FecR protein